MAFGMQPTVSALFGLSIFSLCVGAPIDQRLAVDCSNQHRHKLVATQPHLYRCRNPHKTKPFSGLRQATPLLTRCQPDEMYNPSIDLCLPAVRPANPSPLQSRNLVVETPHVEHELKVSQYPQTSKDCGPDEIYNSELSLCLKRPRPSSSVRTTPKPLSLVRNNVPLEIQAFHNSMQPSDCQSGEVWLSELGICIRPHPVSQRRRRPESASLVRETRRPESASLVRKEASDTFMGFKSAEKCGSNEVFISELGICGPSSPSKSPQKRPEVDSLVLEEQVNNVPETPERKVVCASDELFIAELNICSKPPRKPQGQNRPPPAESLVKEDHRPLEITAFENSQSAQDCAPGQSFISMLGICA